MTFCSCVKVITTSLYDYIILKGNQTYADILKCTDMEFQGQQQQKWIIVLWSMQ